jgi:hypothetical protein
MSDASSFVRLPVLLLGMISLLAGVTGGLARLGFELPLFLVAQAGGHGALMIPAFFGTVISLERAVALGRGWAYLAPVCAGVGGVALVSGIPLVVAQGLLIAAAAVLIAASAAVLRRQVALFTIVLAIGALCWLVGAIAWLVNGSLQPAVPWWLSFLVITIAGERLELTRFLPVRPVAPPLFVAAVGIVLLGACLSLWRAEVGQIAFSAGLVALAAWLLRYDIARRNARQTGLARFIAICLLSGYAWLAAGGLLGVAGAFDPGHAWRDAALHAITLGFVFSMVFGHAPIVFPAVARVRLPYHPVFYAPLAVLHGSLAARVAGGLGESAFWREQGALANAVGLLLFIVTMAAAVFRGRAQRA